MTGDSTISDNLFRIVAIQHNEKRLQALLVPADAFYDLGTNNSSPAPA